MREVKFRGYDLDDKIWRYGAYIKHVNSTPCMFTGEKEKEEWFKEHTEHLIIFDAFSDWWMPRGMVSCTSIDPESIGQFTGLIDRNKKEIFEGDFVEFNSLIPLDSELCKLEGKIGKVVFEECAFCLEFKNKMIPLWIEGVNYRVVGNIYENPNFKEKE